MRITPPCIISTSPSTTYASASPGDRATERGGLRVQAACPRPRRRCMSAWRRPVATRGLERREERGQYASEEMAEGRVHGDKTGGPPWRLAHQRAGPAP